MLFKLQVKLRRLWRRRTVQRRIREATKNVMTRIKAHYKNECRKGGFDNSVTFELQPQTACAWETEQVIKRVRKKTGFFVDRCKYSRRGSIKVSPHVYD